MIKKICMVFALCLMFIFLLPHNDTDAAVKINATSKTMIKGQRYTLKLTGAAGSIKWSSSDPSVVKVSKKGTCLAKKSGNATITAKSGSVKKTCRIKVNDTFGMSTDSVTISNNKKITLTLTVDGAVKSSRANSKICKLEFGEWKGDDVTVTIVPLKVGTTNVTFSNTVNSESCVLKVKVSAIPITAVIDEPVTATGASDYVVSEGSASYPFTLDQDAKDVKFKFLDTKGNTIRTIKAGKLKAGNKKIIIWDGKDNEGQPYEGSYTIAVVADDYVTRSKNTYRIMQESPFGAGDGSKEKPYLVSNVEEFMMMPEYDGENVYFALDSDISFKGSSTGLMFLENPLKGSFCGTWNKIRHRLTGILGAPALDTDSGLYTSGTVFGNISKTGRVCDVDITDVKVTGASAIFALKSYGTIENVMLDGVLMSNQVGIRAALLLEQNFGTVENCKVTGQLAFSMVNIIAPVKLRVGGMVGGNSGRIIDCDVWCEMKGELAVSASVEVNSDYGLYLGGIVGENANVGIITGSHFSGDIEGTSTGDVNYYGGICGINNGLTDSCTFDESENVTKSQGSGNGE